MKDSGRQKDRQRWERKEWASLVEKHHRRVKASPWGRTPRNDNGLAVESEMKIQEQVQADSLRAKTINHMLSNIENFHHLSAAVNSDMPSSVAFCSLEDRILHMANPTSPVGEMEISALSEVFSNPSISSMQRLAALSNIRRALFHWLNLCLFFIHHMETMRDTMTALLSQPSQWH